MPDSVDRAPTNACGVVFVCDQPDDISWYVWVWRCVLVYTSHTSVVLCVATGQSWYFVMVFFKCSFGCLDGTMATVPPHWQPELQRQIYNKTLRLIGRYRVYNKRPTWSNITDMVVPIQINLYKIFNVFITNTHLAYGGPSRWWRSPRGTQSCTACSPRPCTRGCP